MPILLLVLMFGCITPNPLAEDQDGDGYSEFDED